jgi:hypothetical protein
VKLQVIRLEAPTKGKTVFVLIGCLVILAVSAIVITLRDVVTDGYGRVPERW